MQGDDIYDVMLNQTNLTDNNNKFYVVQLLGCLLTLNMFHSAVESVMFGKVMEPSTQSVT